MKKSLCKLVLCMAVSVLSASSVFAQRHWDGTTADTDWAGAGTADSPYLIGTAEELAGLARRTNGGETFEGKHFLLTADISLSDPALEADKRPLWEPIGTYGIENDDAEENPGGWYAVQKWFKGHFDGGGHTVSNLWYNGATDWDDWNDPFGSGQLDFSAWYKALFGCADGAVICNLRIDNANIGGTHGLAALICYARNTEFRNIHITGSAIRIGGNDNLEEKGGSAAQMAVEVYDSRISDCTADANVYGCNASGLVLNLYGASTVSNCSTAGKITGINVSGFIGYSAKDENSDSGATPVLTGCATAAEVYCLNARRPGAAGFIVGNQGTIACCASTGSVRVSWSGAGFVFDNTGLIETCFSSARVWCEEGGVLLSQFAASNGQESYDYGNIPGYIRNCFATGKLEAPAAGDFYKTQYGLFTFGNYTGAGSAVTNCYYNAENVPPTEDMDMRCPVGAFAATPAQMQTEAFVDSLNAMAALMGTHRWKYVPGAYPEMTGETATDHSLLFGGKGSEEEPYLIASKQDLVNLAYAANRNWDFGGKHILQTADIALNAPMDRWGEQMPELWTPIARYYEESYYNNFCGVYDGGYHTVSNLYIDKDGSNYVGLFGKLGSGAVIRNLGVTDAYVDANHECGIIVGAASINNDDSEGPRLIERCWSSGQVTGNSRYTGGIAGVVFSDVAVNGCYSTANTNGYAIVGYVYPGYEHINGCWYGGKKDNYDDHWAYQNGDGHFFDFYDITKNPVNLSHITNAYPTGLTTAQMQSKSFVNALCYAAAAKGFDAAWGWNEGTYPSFVGEKPTLEVTIENGVDEAVTFRAFEGSTLMAPAVPVREGYVLVGWFTDEDCTDPFYFDKTEIKGNTTLYAKWKESVAPDYSVFKNKFAKTFTISTVAQLIAFANIVNDENLEDSGVEYSDFEGKTVKLGADLEYNDPSGIEAWGTQIEPQVFTPIGKLSGYPFKGTFDGQGHTITGLYFAVSAADGNARSGLFGYIGAGATVSDVVLRDAFCYMTKNDNAALFALSVSGTVSRCGVEGSIVDAYTGNYNPTDAGVGGFVYTIGAQGKVSECYADVHIERVGGSTGGFVNENKGRLENCYVTGHVSYSGYGNFGGVVTNTEADFPNCYSALVLTFGEENEGANTGGAYSYKPYGASYNPGFYNRDLVAEALEMVNQGSAYTSPFDKGTGLSTAEMKRMVSFEGFDFTNVWGRRNDTNGGYPYLRWTKPGLDNDSDRTGIASAEADTEAEVTEWYDLGGQRIPRPSASGIYIIRRADGTTAKIVL